MAEKKPDFVISDRRKFTEEGELRSDERVESSVKTQEPAPISQSSPGDNDPMPPPPSTAEQEAQHQEYRASGRKLDDLLTEEGHGKAEDFEMTFERLVQSLYVTTMLQLGMMHREGENPQPDIIGARQTIDTLGVLKDKTKGNLTSKEEGLLQNVLFELRMAFLEITNAITRGPGPRSGKPIAK
jgi:Domain of unknown function (DUF1844)